MSSILNEQKDKRKKTEKYWSKPTKKAKQNTHQRNSETKSY